MPNNFYLKALTAILRLHKKRLIHLRLSPTEPTHNNAEKSRRTMRLSLIKGGKPDRSQFDYDQELDAVNEKISQLTKIKAMSPNQRAKLFRGDTFDDYIRDTVIELKAIHHRYYKY